MAVYRLSNIIIFILVSLSAVGQKIKYKDLYSLLSTRQYETAEPILKNYIKDNSDNPNAYLFMGMIYHENALADDVLLNTERCVERMDSAILYYSKASTGITEKEIKKNKDYYTAYSRRDLRTGEFAVKVSDIQLDLESKMNSLRERIDKVKMVKFYFSKSEDLYGKSQHLFADISKAFPGEREFYLRANESTIVNLKELGIRFDSCAKMFEFYRSSLSSLGKTKYNQAMSLSEINNFKEDGLAPTNFYNDNLAVWDYKKFATKSLNIIEKEVNPTVDNLIKYDIEINKLRSSLENDSVSVKSDLAKLVEKLLNNQLKKFDSDPMPIELFALKINHLEYNSSVLEHRSIKKGNDILAKLKAADLELKYVNRIDSLSAKLLSRNLTEDILNYQQFVTATFTKGDILKGYIKGMKEYADRERASKQKERNFLADALNWIVVEPDSIPIVTTVNHPKYKPLLVTPDFTTGLSFTDSVSARGYFYNITASRKPDIKVTFDVDKVNFTLGRINVMHSLLTSDAAGQIFYSLIFSERNVKGKFPVTVSKIYRSDGLSWATNLMLDFVPNAILLNPDTGELQITSGSGLTATIDKLGKPK
jgi:hypothetical protein